MKYLFLILFNVAQAAETMSFQLAPWSRACKILENLETQCDIPTPNATAFKFDIEFNMPTMHGEAKKIQKDFSFENLNFKGQITFYTVNPPESSTYPPYVQTQIEIQSPVRARCMQSIRWQSPMKMPPLICAALSESTNVEWGLTFENLQ